MSDEVFTPGSGDDQTAERIDGGLSLDAALLATLHLVEQWCEATHASLYLADFEGALRGRRYTTLHTGQPRWEPLDNALAEDVLARQVLETGEAALIGDIQADPRFPRGVVTATRAIALLPMRYRGRPTGVLAVYWRECREFAPDDPRRLATLATVSAIAAENAASHLREVEAARLAGALLVARTAAHEVNNALAVVIGLAEMVRDRAVTGQSVDPSLVDGIIGQAEDISRHIDRLQRIVRPVERILPGLPSILDLERSCAEEGGSMAQGG